jgi:hypothetical protein
MVEISKKISKLPREKGIDLLYTSDDRNKNELFWENIPEPYRSILEECYYIAEDGKFSDLARITHSIKLNRLSYLKLGVQLYQVKFYKLYRGAYKSFKNYCEQAIKYPIWRANQVIEAARVAIELIRFGFKTIPANEAQARPLIQLNSEQLIEKWEQVLAIYPAHKITATRITQVVRGEEYKRKGTLKLPIKLLEEIEYKALENGISPVELVTKMIHGELIISESGEIETQLEDNPNQVETPPAEVMRRWEEDLDKLAYQERTRIDEFAEELAEEVRHAVRDLKLVIKECFIKSFLPQFSSPQKSLIN